MKYLIYIFLSLLFFKHTLAVDYFDYLVHSSLLSVNNITMISFLYKLEGYEENDFLVRPFTELGQISIFNPQTNNWQPANALWSELPYLQKEMKIKLQGYGSAKVYFKILNLVNGEIYQTRAQKLWFRDAYKGYIKILNENVLANF